MRAELVAVDPLAAVSGEIDVLSMPLWTPWPMPTGWRFAGMAVGHVTEGPVQRTRACATVSTWCGPDPFGDPTEVLLVCEEAGMGVGSHFAGVEESYPARGVGEGPPHARFSLGGHPVLLWSVDTTGDGELIVLPVAEMSPRLIVQLGGDG